MNDFRVNNDIRVKTITVESTVNDPSAIPTFRAGELVYSPSEKTMIVGNDDSTITTLVGEDASGNVNINGGILLNEQATRPTDPTGTSEGLLWIETGVPNSLVFTDDSGNDVTITIDGLVSAGSLRTTGNPVVISGSAEPNIGDVLTATGANSATWQPAGSGGILPVANGGTGASSLTDGGVLLGSGTGAVTVTAQPTNGQLLVGSTGVDPVLATLTAGTNVSIVNGAGSISISSSTASPTLFTASAFLSQIGWSITSSYTRITQADGNLVEKYIVSGNSGALTLEPNSSNTIDHDGSFNMQGSINRRCPVWLEENNNVHSGWILLLITFNDWELVLPNTWPASTAIDDFWVDAEFTVT